MSPISTERYGRTYRDADGIERFCEVCETPLAPIILENFWEHVANNGCSAIRDNCGMREYSRKTAIEVTR